MNYGAVMVVPHGRKMKYHTIPEMFTQLGIHAVEADPANVTTCMTALARSCDRIMICPVDSSFVNNETLLELMDARADVVLPEDGGMNTHPLLVSSRIVPWLSRYNGNRGFVGAIESLYRTENCTFKKMRLKNSAISRYERARQDYQRLIAI